MIEERYPGDNKAGKVEAKIILGRCPNALSKTENLYGIRIQKFGSDWFRTWAFKIDAERAHKEGYDREITTGSFRPVESYPGCPYCGSTNIAKCCCGKSFCFKMAEYHAEHIRLTCPWCGQSGMYNAAERLDLQGGGL